MCWNLWLYIPTLFWEDTGVDSHEREKNIPIEETSDFAENSKDNEESNRFVDKSKECNNRNIKVERT